MHRFILILMLLFSFNAHANESFEDYVVGVDDKISVTVYRSEDLSIEVRVSSNGEIAFPLLGQVKVAGYTTNQIEKILSKALVDKKLLVSPQINVEVTDYQSKTFSIFGHVTVPGKYPIKRPLKLADAIAIAGGYTLTASDIVTIVSNNEGVTSKNSYDIKLLLSDVNGKGNPVIKNGDIIQVPKHAVFYIYGQVNIPGEYKVEPNMRVSQALALGGGVTLRGTTRSMVIERTGKDGKVTKIPAKLDVVLQPNDVIYVDESLF
jgi:polysaccharide biosynthesis/export protein